MAGHWVKLLQNLIRHTEATRNRVPVLGSFTPRTVETVASDCLRLPQLVSDCLDHQDLGFVKTPISFWRYSMFTYFTFKLAGLKMHWICTP